jgi:predicted alpha/beta hydrolase family esterase
MPTLKDFSILIHPGLNGSGPNHWHTHWERDPDAGLSCCRLTID